MSKRNLASARVTAASFLRHNEGIPFSVLLSDEVQGCFDPALEQFQVTTFEQLGLPDADALRSLYDEMELSYALTPHFIRHLIAGGAEGVLFLKQETMVLDSVLPLFEKLRSHSVLLTPHLLAPPAIPDALEQEINVLRAGVFNGGVIGFSDSAEAMAVLEWWQKRTSTDCIRAVEDGLHFEQRWLDFVPSLAANCHILRDAGVNVGHWNVRDRHISHENGQYFANGAPLRVFRFSGYQPERPQMVTRYNNELTVADTGAAAGVFREYQAMLERSGYDECQRWPYAYGVAG